MAYQHTFIGGPLDGTTVTTRRADSAMYRTATGHPMSTGMGDRYIRAWNLRRAPRDLPPGVYSSDGGLGYRWFSLIQADLDALGADAP